MTTDLRLRLDEDGADDSRLDELTRSLREELLGLDVDRVERARSTEPAPEGSRAVDAMTVNELVVGLTAAAPLVASVADVVVAWVRRKPDRTAELTLGDRRLTISGASEEQQDRLIELFAQELGRSDAG